MKTNIKFIATALILCLIGHVFAQRPKEIKDSEVEGIYLNVSDFKQSKLTRPTDKQHKGDKIKLKQFFISPDIISIEQDKETVFYKDSIFAIRLTNGENYRFINRTPCFIADTSLLYIYTFNTIKTENKISGPHRRSKEIPITYYYFSNNLHKTVLMLTLDNLRKYALSDNLVHKTVCDKFSSDAKLYEINSETGRFVLNETMLSVVKQ